MFTGIIEELGVIKGLVKTKGGARLTIESKVCASDTKIGYSINVNGACLTVVDIKGVLLSFDVSSETLDKTVIGKLKIQDRVNIERSLKADSRLGGHFVTGHVDGVGKIASKKAKGEFVVFEFEIPKHLIFYVAEKGSIAIDGISLTVNTIKGNLFSVLLIPHTVSNTAIGFKREGDAVNIETDILAKYLERLSKKPANSAQGTVSNITKGLLKEHGFI